MERKFARLRRGSVPDSVDVSVVPSDGMCLSVFLVFRTSDRHDRVLLGKVDPSAAWRELSALGPDRLGRLLNLWLLPACQLMLFESPDAAARRVAEEQLGIPLEEVPRPRVFSETSARAGMEGRDPHWDLHYVYELPWPEGRPLRAAPWKELAMVDIARTPRSEFGRGHADVLELIGLTAAP
jgi:8-oxo-dGTP pyrophosphatase MutT (NUDIX family)